LQVSQALPAPVSPSLQPVSKYKGRHKLAVAHQQISRFAPQGTETLVNAAGVVQNLTKT
jgi:hypothetical protein